MLSSKAFISFSYNFAEHKTYINQLKPYFLENVKTNVLVYV